MILIYRHGCELRYTQEYGPLQLFLKKLNFMCFCVFYLLLLLHFESITLAVASGALVGTGMFFEI